MYLRFTRRNKDGKAHRYWSVVESRRCADGRVVQKPLLYLGEINDSQHAAWCRVIEGFDEERQLALFPAGQALLSTPRHTVSRCSSGRCNCTGRANGARAGSPTSSTSNSGSIGSGRGGWRTRAKAPAGVTCCRPCGRLEAAGGVLADRLAIEPKL